MNEKQKTIKNEIILSGVGLHTGCAVEVKLKPAQENVGINFIRVDLPGQPVIKAELANILEDTEIPRCTSLGCDNVIVHTVEHLMAVLCGLGIHNLTIELDAQELPGFDGSARDFLKAIQEVGILEQNVPAPYFDIQEPIGVEKNGCSIYIVPAKEFQVSYILDYEHPFLKSQFLSMTIDAQRFEKDIALARTFCLEEEVIELQKKGLGKGANYQNTLVVTKDGIKENTLRFDDECARHKVLDFIGDLYLLGKPIRGRVFAVKSGHFLNIQLLKKIYAQIRALRVNNTPLRANLDSQDAKLSTDILFTRKALNLENDKKKKGGMDINEIKKVLPHRYPFLLVDRILEMETGKRAIGVKNVTANDNFFQGHFPTRPIMPGVLMIEAMAQVAGVIILSEESHQGQLSFFMAVDNVKFRKVVVPGDQLVMEVDVVKNKKRVAKVRGIAKVDGQIVVEADMTFSFTDAFYLNP